MKQIFVILLIFLSLISFGCSTQTTAQPSTPNPAQQIAQQYADSGVAHYEKEEYSQAVDDLSQAIKMSRPNPVCFNIRGICYLHMGLYDDAINDFNSAIALKTVSDYFNNRGKAYAHKNQHDLAVQDYTRAIEIKPDNYYAYVNRSDSLFELSMNDQAFADLEFVVAHGDQTSVAIAKNDIIVRTINIDARKKGTY